MVRQQQCRRRLRRRPRLLPSRAKGEANHVAASLLQGRLTAGLGSAAMLWIVPRDEQEPVAMIGIETAAARVVDEAHRATLGEAVSPLAEVVTERAKSGSIGLSRAGRMTGWPSS
jgi:hypothetical protein